MKKKKTGKEVKLVKVPRVLEKAQEIAFGTKGKVAGPWNQGPWDQGHWANRK